MAVKIRGLKVLTYALGMTGWTYLGHGDTRKDIEATGYFNDASDMVSDRDSVFLCLADGAGHGVFWVEGQTVMITILTWAERPNFPKAT